MERHNGCAVAWSLKESKSTQMVIELPKSVHINDFGSFYFCTLSRKCSENLLIFDQGQESLDNLGIEVLP